MMTHQKQFDAIGTTWDIVFTAPIATPEVIWQTIAERIETFDQTYSRFRSDSLITHIATEGGTHALPEDAKPLLDLYRDLYKMTSGAFTPLIGKVMEEAGYDAAYSLVPKTLHQPPAFDTAVQYQHPMLTVSEPVLFDFGAAGKGYLVDIVAEILQNHGAVSYVIDAGGDIAVYGTPVPIGLEDPADAEKAIGTVTITHGSTCGSAGNRRSWNRFHHIIDPHTLESPREVLAVWVVAETTMIADALATALYFTPPAALQKKYAFEYLVLRPDYSVERSKGFPVELFT